MAIYLQSKSNGCVSKVFLKRFDIYSTLNTCHRISVAEVMDPCAGQRKARKHLADIIDIFNRAGYMVTTHITEHSGDGEAAVERYAPEMDLVVCCGGDGTFNETISGVLKSGKDR